jgi:uncharacterized protein
MDNLTLETLKQETARVPSAKELGFLSVKSSSIQGLGLFTSQELPANQILFKITGNKVHHEYWPELSACNPNWLGTGYEEWLIIEDGDLGVYINHSCHPNVSVNERLEVITLRPVSRNEELLLDYSTTELDPYWNMKCSCGQPHCRKILRSFQYLPPKLQEDYSRYLSPAFLNGLSFVTNQALRFAK